jgi:periplasmic protein TonB
MGMLPLGSFRDSNDRSQPWLSRVSENLRLALRTSSLPSASSANGTPLHFETIDLSRPTGRAHTFSAGLHITILIILLLAIASGPPTGTFRHATPLGPMKNLLSYVPPPQPQSIGQPSLGSDGSGGGRDTRPPRFGNLALGSSIPLVPPRLVRNDHPILPAPPAVFDPNAPENVPIVTNLGLPWMNSDTDSAGRGNGHGFGDSDGDTMGNRNGNGAGEGDDHGPYANVASPVSCIYCPEPGYTEEARKAKLQGKLLLQVLVGADGRATRIRVLQGLGLGLDEQAIETIRTWRFSPGRDAGKRPVSAWVTIETHFQLY